MKPKDSQRTLRHVAGNTQSDGISKQGKAVHKFSKRTTVASL
jgi:hypothetical protein